MFLDFNKWLGINTQIESEKKPIYVVEEQVNLEIARKPGALTRRKPYVTIITAGIVTSIKSLFEFINTNGDRLLLGQDDTGLKESIETTSYAAFTALDNDNRSGTPLVDQMYPTVYENVIRAGAGIVGTNVNYVPFWYGYVAVKKRYHDLVTIAAGKYAEDQSPHQTYSSGSFLQVVYAARAKVGSFTGKVPSIGLKKGFYWFTFSYVLEDGQRVFPSSSVYITDPLADASSQDAIYDPYGYNVTAENQYLSLEYSIPDARESNLVRVDKIDVYVGYSEKEIDAKTALSIPSYFLERIDLNAYGNPVWQGSASYTTGPNNAVISNFADWQSFPLIGMFIHDKGNDSYHEITAVAHGASDVTLTLADAPTVGTEASELVSGWIDSSSVHVYRYFYDNSAKKLGKEMYSRIGIPPGDQGITDFRYKYSAINGKRLLVCGVTDHPGGNYSLPYNLDVIPALNVVKTHEEPLGCVPYGENFLIFSKRYCTHLSIYGNENSRQIDDYVEATIVSQKSVVNAGRDLVFGFDYEGPWLLGPGTGLLRIGDSLYQWWDETLSDTIKDGCIVIYNRLKGQVLYYFPDYATAPYTNGLAFVFDIKAWEDNKVYPWFYFTTDKTITAWCTATDNHTLIGDSDGDDVHDLSQDGGTDESVSSWVKLKVIKNRLAGKKRMWIDTLSMEYTGETLTVEIFEDGGSAVDVSSDLTTNDKLFLRRFLEEFQLKITPAAGTGEFKFITAQLTYNERTF